MLWNHADTFVKNLHLASAPAPLNIVENFRLFNAFNAGEQGCKGWPSEIFGETVSGEDITLQNYFPSVYSRELADAFEFLRVREEPQYREYVRDLNRRIEESGGGVAGYTLSSENLEDIQEAITKADNVTLHTFSGPHPAGNVGVQIHHIAPINKGDVVWTLQPDAVVSIGKLFLEGRLKSERLVALCGECCTDRQHIRTITGSSIASIIAGKSSPDTAIRYICGDVLSGTKVSSDGYLCFNSNQLTLIPECQNKEFMGWTMPGLVKESFSKLYPSFLFKNKEFSHDTGYHGGIRAFVQTGEYEMVMPMDIYPVHLLKSILYEDLEEMEGLGILEVAEEDFALCDYICVSKIEAQFLIRKGLDFYRKETT